MPKIIKTGWFSGVSQKYFNDLMILTTRGRSSRRPQTSVPRQLIQQNSDNWPHPAVVKIPLKFLHLDCNLHQHQNQMVCCSLDILPLKNFIRTRQELIDLSAKLLTCHIPSSKNFFLNIYMCLDYDPYHYQNLTIWC